MGLAGARSMPSRIGLSCTPPAHAHKSWCDLVEAHITKVALLAEPMRTNATEADVARLSSVYDRAVPAFNTVGYATFWHPNVCGSPDIRGDTRVLIDAMRNM